ncbi:MAG: hypothetical protein HY868_06315 [Chloroflexi bacterium]|nr:hypothetical protein [Chloroflexota bacterium]
MGTILASISLVVVLIVVLALVAYLLGIIAALRGANRNLYQLAGGLDAIVKDTQPLTGKLSTINGALTQLLTGLLAVEADLAAVARLLRR